MCFAKDLKNIALLGAVRKGDINATWELLAIHGANPDYQSLMHFATEANDVEVIKLLLQYGAKVDDAFMRYMVDLKNVRSVKAIVSHIFDYNKDLELVQEIFLKLVKIGGSSALGLLKLLLDHEFPMDDYIDDTCEYYRDGYTPLQLSIKYGIEDFVLLLLEKGADIHKKTYMGTTCLWLAINHNSSSILDILLSKGARVNERIWSSNGPTALHEACELGESSETISTLVDHGADLNALASNRRTPLMVAIRSDAVYEEILVKKLARMSFEGQPVCSRNLNSLKRKRFLKNMFKDCLEELKKLGGREVYEGLSLYDVLRMSRCQPRKLTTLTKKRKFVEAFKTSWDSELFEYYGKDLDDVFDRATERRDALRDEEKKLYSVFKNHLPQLPIFRIAYFAKEDLFF